MIGGEWARCHLRIADKDFSFARALWFVVTGSRNPKPVIRVSCFVIRVSCFVKNLLVGLGRLAPRPDGLLTHFASHRSETCRLKHMPLLARAGVAFRRKDLSRSRQRRYNEGRRARSLPPCIECGGVTASTGLHPSWRGIPGSELP